MARPIKKGLDYFPFDVTYFEEDAIELIAADFGLKGQVAAIRLTALAYRGEGYYYPWNRRACTLLCKRTGGGLCPEVYENIVRRLCEYAYFDAGVFQKHSVLTSAEIQKRYIRACEKRRRITLVKDYMLIDYKDFVSRQEVVLITLDGTVFSAENRQKGVSGPGNPLNYGINPQSKGKQTKENESTANKSTEALPPAGCKAVSGSVEKSLEAAGIAAAPATRKMLEGFIKNGMDEECIKYAIGEAGQKARNKPAYLRSILARMEEDGITTKGALDAERKTNRPAAGTREGELPPDDYFNLHNSWDEI